MKKTAIVFGLLSACISTLAAEQAEDAVKFSTLVYDDNHIISLGDHNHQDFFD